MLAEWIANDERRNDPATAKGRIGRSLDLAFYTATYRLGEVVIVGGVIAVAVLLLTGNG